MLEKLLFLDSLLCIYNKFSPKINLSFIASDIGFKKKILARPEGGILVSRVYVCRRGFRPITQSKIFFLKPIDNGVPWVGYKGKISVGGGTRQTDPIDISCTSTIEKSESFPFYYRNFQLDLLMIL